MAMTTSVPSSVEAEVNYLLYTGVRPVGYAYPAPPGVPQQSGAPLPTRVQISNARALAEPPSLDRQGFELRAAPSEFADFWDEKAIRGVYYPETVRLLQAATGAVKVVIFDHTLRLGIAGHGEPGVREPVRRVHNDQTFVSGPRRVRDHLPPAEADERLRKRFAIINVWRPIGGVVRSSPLALCDARSIETDDLVATDLVYRDKVGETYSVLPRTRHRWFYFPEVTPSEVVLIKIYDSQTEGTARLSFHTAFDDPTTSSDAPPRRSIELRTLVFFDS
jgi:hypothetical protein